MYLGFARSPLICWVLINTKLHCLSDKRTTKDKLHYFCTVNQKAALTTNIHPTIQATYNHAQRNTGVALQLSLHFIWEHLLIQS